MSSHDSQAPVTKHESLGELITAATTPRMATRIGTPQIRCTASARAPNTCGPLARTACCDRPTRQRSSATALSWASLSVASVVQPAAT